MYDIIRYKTSTGEVGEFVPAADGSSVLSVGYDAEYVDISAVLEPSLGQDEVRAWSASKTGLDITLSLDPYFKGYFLSGEYGLRLIPTLNPEDILLTLKTYTAARVDLVETGTFISNDNTLVLKIRKDNPPPGDSGGFDDQIDFDSLAPTPFAADDDIFANDIFANRGFFNYIDVDSMDARVIRVDSLYTDGLYLDSLYSRIITADSAIINNAIIRGGSLTASTLQVEGGNIVELTSQIINVGNYVLGKEDNIISYADDDSANISWDPSIKKWRIDPGIFNNATLDDLNNLFPRNLNDGFLTYDKDTDTHSLDKILKVGRFVYDSASLNSEINRAPIGYIHKFDSEQKIAYYNDWIRFSHMNERFDDLDPAVFNQPWKSDEAERWFYYDKPDFLAVDSETASFAGMISRNVVENYEIQATFSSIDSDNGVAALVLAFVEDTDDEGNTKEHTLSLIRRPKNYFDVSGLTPEDANYPGPSETTAYAVVYNYRQTDEKYLRFDFYNNIAPAPTPVTGPGQNLDTWTSAGATRVYAKKVTQRTGTPEYSLTVKCSQFGSTTLDPATQFVIYLDLLPETEKFIEGVRFGFGGNDQSKITVRDITIKELDENSNLVFDLKNDLVYHYVAEEELSDDTINLFGATQEGHYIFDINESYKDFFPSSRLLHNRRTLSTYYITDDGAITNPIEIISNDASKLGIPVEASGTSETSADLAYLYVDNEKIYTTHTQGLKLTVLTETGKVLTQALYNTSTDSSASDNLATAISEMEAKSIGVITSSVKYTGSVTDELRAAAKEAGLIKLANSAQAETLGTSYAAIFQKNPGYSVKAYEITGSGEVRASSGGGDEPGGSTIDQIFATWYRFSHSSGSFTYPAIPSETQSWTYDSSTERIVSTLNTSSYTGFVSDITADEYTLEVSIQSPGADDDALAVVIAFTSDGVIGDVNNPYREYTLSAVRTMGGFAPTSGWGVYYNYRQSDQKLIGSTLSVPFVSGGWAANGESKVFVSKEGSAVTATTSQNGSLTLDPSTQISVDLSADSDLQKFTGAVQIGFGAFSQNDGQFYEINSTFPSFAEPIIDSAEKNPASLMAIIAKGSYYVLGGNEVSGFVSYDGEYVAFVDSRGSLAIDEDHTLVLASGENGGLEFDKNSPEMKMRVLNGNELHFTVPDEESVKINNFTVWNQGNVEAISDNENIFNLDSATHTFTYVGPKLTSDNTSVLSLNDATHTFTYVGPKLTSDNTNVLSLNQSTHTFTYVGPKLITDNEDALSLNDATHTFTYSGIKFSTETDQDALNFDSATNSFSFNAPKIVSLVTDNPDVLSLDSSITTFFYVGPKVSTDNEDLFDLDSATHTFTYVGPKVSTDNSSVFSLDSASHAFTYIGPKLISNNTNILSLNQSTHTFTFDETALKTPSLVSDNTNVLSLNTSTVAFTYVGPKVSTDNADVFSIDSATHTFTYIGPKVSTDNASVFSLDSASHTFTYIGPKLISNNISILSLDSASHTLTFDANALNTPSLITDNTNILSLNTSNLTFTYVGPKVSTDNADVFSFDSATHGFTYVGPKLVSDNTDILNLDSATHTFTYQGPKLATNQFGTSILTLDSASHTFTYLGPRLISNNTSILSLDNATHTWTFDADGLNVPSLVTDNNNILSLNAADVIFNYTGPKVSTDNADVFSFDSATHGFTYVGPKLITDNANVLSLDSATHVFTYVGPKLITDNADVLSLDSATHVFTYVGPKLVSDNVNVMSLDSSKHAFNYIGPKLITDDPTILSLNPATHTFTFNSANIEGGGGGGGGCSAVIFGGTALTSDMLVSYQDSCYIVFPNSPADFADIATATFSGLDSGAQYLIEQYSHIYWPDGPTSLTQPVIQFSYEDSGSGEIIIRSNKQSITQYTPIFAHYLAVTRGTVATIRVSGRHTDGFGNRGYELKGATFKLTKINTA